MSNFCSDASHLKQKRAIYSLVKDMCISTWGHWKHFISWEKNVMRNQMKKFPAPGFEPWPRTATWCSQILYPLNCGELVDHAVWILKSCFRCPMHCKDQALKHMRYSREWKRSPLQWFAIDSVGKKKLFPPRFADFMKDYLFSFIRESK